MAASKAKLSRATTGKNDAPPSLHKVVLLYYFTFWREELRTVWHGHQVSDAASTICVCSLAKGNS